MQQDVKYRKIKIEHPSLRLLRANFESFTFEMDSQRYNSDKEALYGDKITVTMSRWGVREFARLLWQVIRECRSLIDCEVRAAASLQSELEKDVVSNHGI